MQDLPIYFIRHNFTAIGESAKTLLEQGYIAFHFVDEFFDQKEHYSVYASDKSKGFIRAYDAFAKIGQHGAIVVFEYHEPDSFHIATVSPEQQIRAERFQTAAGKEIIYKVLPYKNTHTYSYAENPVLLALRPPYSTVCQPREHYQQIIRHLYLGRPIPRSVNLLHPTMLEQLCENYLRSQFVAPDIRLQYAILKTGKTLPTLDIVGRTAQGQKLLVQVTHHRGLPAEQKARLLASIHQTTENAISIMFSADASGNPWGVTHHFNITEVFNAFAQSSEQWHLTMVNDMLGITSNAPII